MILELKITDYRESQYAHSRLSTRGIDKIEIYDINETDTIFMVHASKSIDINEFKNGYIYFNFDNGKYFNSICLNIKYIDYFRIYKENKYED